MDQQKDFLNILRNIHNYTNFSQRSLAKKVGLSLGKINYCLSALKQKGLVKAKNFRNKKEEKKYLYTLTRKGIYQKTKLTVDFMNLKMKEYDELKQEVKKDVARSKN